MTHVEYLRGVGATDNNECANLFKEYSTCLQVSSLVSSTQNEARLACMYQS